jgi:hypothetical protein
MHPLHSRFTNDTEPSFDDLISRDFFYQKTLMQSSSVAVRRTKDFGVGTTLAMAGKIEICTV